MKKYRDYFWYVLRHKYFVFIECLKYGLVWQGITHDLSKFRLDEAIPYAIYFYGGDKRDKRFYTPSQGTDEFNAAWVKHQHRNPHHWQYWVLQEDSGVVFPLKMPLKYAIEMICDWRGAGIASGHPDTLAWYLMNKDKMVLHKETRKLVEDFLGLGDE